MIRGCQKQLVVTMTAQSHLFESAWFVLREGRTGESEEDMIAEANRIVSGGVLPRRRRPLLLWYGVAFLLGGLSSLGILALCSFFR